MKESITVEDRQLTVYDQTYMTECDTRVVSATVYDAKNGEALMEDITLTNFEIEHDQPCEG